MAQQWRLGSTLAGLLLAGCAMASDPPPTRTEFEDLRDAVAVNRGARDAVQAQCRADVLLKPQDEQALIGAVLDVDTVEVPDIFCARLVAAIARGDVGYADFVAMTEGSLGYILQQALLNQLRKRDMKTYVVTVVTQVVVDASDPAFEAYNKPIGPVLTREEAERRRDEWGWQIGRNPGDDGYRRYVPSPRPLRVIQRHMIRETAQAGHIVVACGGGGVPRKFASTNRPRFTGDVRSGFDVTSSALPWVSMPPRGLSMGRITLRISSPVTSGMP